MTIKENIKKNWKLYTLILLISGLILFNVKQYQASQAIVRENLKINEQYQALLGRQVIYDQQIAEYKTQVAKKDSVIASQKTDVAETEAELAVSQGEARRLSKKVKELSVQKPEELQEYVETCDSLSIVAPLLADQVDTLKSQNKALVTTMEEKSVIQDSIIKKKDVIISENKTLLATTVDSYNKATDKLVLTENKLNKEKKRKSFWKKATLALAAVVAGVIAVK